MLPQNEQCSRTVKQTNGLLVSVHLQRQYSKHHVFVSLMSQRETLKGPGPVKDVCVMYKKTSSVTFIKDIFTTQRQVWEAFFPQLVFVRKPC